MIDIIVTGDTDEAPVKYRDTDDEADEIRFAVEKNPIPPTIKNEDPRIARQFLLESIRLVPSWLLF